MSSSQTSNNMNKKCMVRRKTGKRREDRQGKEEATKQMHSNPETTEDHESKLKKTRIISNTCIFHKNVPYEQNFKITP